MNVKRLFLAAPLLALAAVAQADNVDVTDLADRTGLTERQVRMVLGAPSTYAEYRTSHWVAERRVMAALSDPGYYYEGVEPVVVYTREPVVYTRETVVDERVYDDDDVDVDVDVDADGDVDVDVDAEPVAGQLKVEDVDDD